jgi:hypothetical protein
METASRLFYPPSTITYPPTSNFSVKEKDEASPVGLFLSGFVECLHSRFVAR